MKVYVVSYRPNDEDRTIDGVFSTYDTAAHVAEALCAINEGEPGDVDEFELDELCT
jgi:hypothetical protein